MRRDQGMRFFLFLRRRALRTLRPFRLAILALNPIFLAREILLGLYVLFISPSPSGSHGSRQGSSSLTGGSRRAKIRDARPGSEAGSYPSNGALSRL